MAYNILISIVIPSLNEEKLIEIALKSIRNQSINQDEIEILLIDGGSKDRTREIAKNYNVQIIDNPKIVPEEAVLIGLNRSTGKYIVFMGADEELTDKDQLKKRIEYLNKNTNVKAIMANSLKTPNDYPSLTRYVNSFGDPFSYFVYKFDSENMVSSYNLRKMRNIDIDEYFKIYYPEKGNIVPIGDGRVTFDYEYLKNNFGEKFSYPHFVSTMFDEIVYKTGCFGIIKDDFVNHRTTTKFNVYLKKLKFRVITNLNPKDNISGYITRTKLNKKLGMRRYLFLFYCLFIPLVLLDSIIYSIKKRNIIFLLHFIFVYYVILNILFYIIVKSLKIKTLNKNYGK